ncbi:hypothetical protein AVEN_46968-2 [Araneus ventricosus]|uniref:Low-density lipoprotein receptor-related protein 2 n=1 Tax=Araneus ventricosus TaxID=182803 RepID=A0A4Y2I4X7_ARAVE|nr:hypothetical protein AVEN_46968-2 [Araneus ventricosus]
MSRTLSLQVVLISLVAAAFLHYGEGNFLEAAAPCPPLNFKCMNGNCISPVVFCNGKNECGDNSDEKFCKVEPSFRCPDDWTSCPNRRRCIPSHWMCDGRKHCPVVSEETICAKKSELMSWFLQRRNSGNKADRWGPQVNRIAVALHLANKNTFSPGNSTGEEIRYELAMQLTRRLAKDKKMSSEELALYIHALLVACMDPTDFYGDNLVQELRKRVEADESYTNPFLILVLCNAGDAMTNKDVERVSAAYDSQHRPFWTDTQALASMALYCITNRSGVEVDVRILRDYLQDLKKHRFPNGTVDNFRTTALVVQALFIYDSYQTEFNLELAMKVLMDGVNATKSILTAYYILPALHEKSLIDVSSSHCSKQPVEEDDALQKILVIDGETMTVHYSVWIGDEINVGRTWRLKISVKSTIYDAIETVAKIDNRQKVEYNVVKLKPYVAALNGKEDDPEMGMFWFVYLKPINSEEEPKVVEKSPADVKLEPNQEIILWYKRGSWNVQPEVKQDDKSSTVVF